MSKRNKLAIVFMGIIAVIALFVFVTLISVFMFGTVSLKRTFSDTGAAADEKRRKAGKVKLDYSKWPSIQPEPYLPKGEELILLSSKDDGTKGNIYYMTTDKYQLFQWMPSADKDNSSQSISHYAPTPFGTNFLIFEDGTYDLYSGYGEFNQVIFSPDGRKRAVSRLESQKINVYYSGDLGESFEDPISRIEKFNVLKMAWSEEGDRLYFVDTQTADNGQVLHTVYAVNPDGSNLIKLYEQESREGTPQLSIIPGRSEILFHAIHSNNGSNGAENSFVLINTANQTVETLEIQNPTIANIEIKGLRKSIKNLSVSPDGNKLAYMVFNDRWVLEVMEVDWSAQPKVKPLGSMPGDGRVKTEFNFVWTADSERIVFKHNDPDGGCYETFKVSNNGAPGVWSETCLYTLTVWDLDQPDELTFPFGKFSFSGQILGSVER